MVTIPARTGRESKQVSAVADEPARRAASRQTCCKQKWTLTVINLRSTQVDNACDGRRFRVIASDLSKVANCIWRLRWGWPSVWVLPRSSAAEHYSPWAIVWRCLRDPTFNRFSGLGDAQKENAMKREASKWAAYGMNLRKGTLKGRNL